MKKLLLISLVLVPIILCTRFLRDENEDSEEEEEEAMEILRSDNLEVAEYCAAEQEQYIYFCHGIWSIDKIRRIQRKLAQIEKFCAGYKKSCVKRGGVEFEVSAEEELSLEAKAERRKRVENRAEDMVFEEVMEKLAEIVPCRPNCDVTIHPHCTRRCKCEYESRRIRNRCSRRSSRNDYYCQLWYASCSGYLGK